MKLLSRVHFLTVALTMLVCGVFIQQTAYSQEVKPEKKIRVKVITVKDGEESTFDTTFNGEDFDNEALKKEMKEKYGIEMEDLEGEVGVKVKVDSEKADAVGIETGKEAKKVVVIKEVNRDSDEELIWEEIGKEPDSTDRAEKIYIINKDGEKFTIKEGGDDEKVLRIITEEGESKVIEEGDGKKVILITEEGETKIIKDKDGEKVIMIKVDDEQCDKSKKDKKVKEEIIKVIVITDDDDDIPEPDKK
ncbi:MAG TPA: hypothetical protein PK711_08720 [Bacteroidales bacterium]|nr:hypothetical protein [Bacteroidales bacterium]